MQTPNDDAPTTVPDGMNDAATPTVYPIPDELLPLFRDRGVVVPDLWWWSFDTFLVKLVEAAATKLINDGCGYPCSHIIPSDNPCTCEADWRTYLEGIRDDLAGYDKFASYATAEQYERVQNAMRRMIDRMGNWWD
jgi:hypothetical protein